MFSYLSETTYHRLMWISDVLRWRRMIHWFCLRISLSSVTAQMFRLDHDRHVWSEIMGRFWVKHIFSLLVRVTLPMFLICKRQDHISWRLNIRNVIRLESFCFPILFSTPRIHPHFYPANEDCGKVMFSYLSVHCGGGGGVLCDHYHDAWDHTVQGPLQTWDLRTPQPPHGTSGPCLPLLPTSGDHQWRPVHFRT